MKKLIFALLMVLGLSLITPYGTSSMAYADEHEEKPVPEQPKPESE